MIRWEGDVGYWADGRVPWPVAWVSIDGWRVPGTSGTCSSRAKSRRAAELCLAEIVRQQPSSVGSMVEQGRRTWERIRSLLEREPLTVRELAERAGTPPNIVTDWLRRRGGEVQPVGLRLQQGAERARRVVVWGLR